MRTVLIVGDSHVAGPPGRALEELLYASGAELVHRVGVVGWGPQEWVAEGLGSRPELADTVILWFGSNDPPTARTAQAEAELGKSAGRYGADVWWVGAPSYARADLQERSDKLAAISRKIYGRHFIDSRPLVPAGDPGRTPDGVHVRPGPLANSWAEAIVATIDRRKSAPAVWASLATLGLVGLGLWGMRWARR